MPVGDEHQHKQDADSASQNPNKVIFNIITSIFKQFNHDQLNKISTAELIKQNFQSVLNPFDDNNQKKIINTVLRIHKAIEITDINLINQVNKDELYEFWKSVEMSEEVSKGIGMTCMLLACVPGPGWAGILIMMACIILIYTLLSIGYMCVIAMSLLKACCIEIYHAQRVFANASILLVTAAVIVALLVSNPLGWGILGAVAITACTAIMGAAVLCTATYFFRWLDARNPIDNPVLPEDSRFTHLSDLNEQLDEGIDVKTTLKHMNFLIDALATLRQNKYIDHTTSVKMLHLLKKGSVGKELELKGVKIKPSTFFENKTDLEETRDMRNSFSDPPTN